MALAPKGRKAIAHRFNGGLVIASQTSPAGTKEAREPNGFFRPLHDFTRINVINPAMNRGAILGPPCGTAPGAFLPCESCPFDVPPSPVGLAAMSLCRSGREMAGLPRRLATPESVAGGSFRSAGQGVRVRFPGRGDGYAGLCRVVCSLLLQRQQPSP